MKQFVKVPITKGLFAIVDKEDVEKISNHKWHTCVIGRYRYAGANGPTGYLWMHKVILGASRLEMVDHINFNTLDNRKCNLRKCTVTQNLWHRRKRKGSRSKYKGVWMSHGRWCAKITAHKKNYWLGYFETELDAAKAYDKAAAHHHGEFAYLNFDKNRKDDFIGHEAPVYKKRVLRDKTPIVCGKISKIPLTRGLYAIVDAVDLPILSEKRWFALRQNKGFLPATTLPGKPGGRRQIQIAMYNFLMNPADDMVVDHINHDCLDNRRANLRLCTTNQNNQHRRKSAGCLYKGISLKHGKWWEANIGFNKKHYYLGIYKTPEEAARAYDKAARKFHKEFAVLNFQ